MGFRFRRSIRLFPGFPLNLSRSGVSASVGRRGAWLTLDARGARATVGIPGTGLSYSEQSPWARPKPSVQTSALASAPGVELTELPIDEIEVPPAQPPRTVSAEAALAETATKAHAPAANERIDEQDGNQRLVLIALVIVAIVAIVALGWALLV